MVQKRRVLTDDFKEYTRIRKSPSFPHPLKKAKLETIEGNRALQKYAEKRMSFLLNSLYPEMSAERKQQLANKFRENTGIMKLPYRIFTGAVSDGIYSDILKNVRVSKRSLNDRASLLNVLDHEAVHFLSDEFKRLNSHEIGEFIATGIHSSISPNKAEKAELRKLKEIDFSNQSALFPLPKEYAGKEFSSAKHLEEMKTGLFSDRNLPDAFLITSMSELLDKNLGLKARNQFLRDTMDGKNPVISFNNRMKQKGIQAVIEGKQIKIKKVKP